MVYTLSSTLAAEPSKSPAKALAGELAGHLAGKLLHFLYVVAVDAAAMTVTVGVLLPTIFEQALEISIGSRPASATGVDAARFCAGADDVAAGLLSAFDASVAVGLEAASPCVLEGAGVAEEMAASAVPSSCAIAAEVAEARASASVAA